MSHTPGPWFVPERTGTQYVEARIGGGWLQEVAACGPTEKPEEQRANARLIAAAPQLLEALEAICDEQDAQEGYATYETYDRARAAIRAAKGEA